MATRLYLRSQIVEQQGRPDGTATVDADQGHAGAARLACLSMSKVRGTPPTTAVCTCVAHPADTQDLMRIFMSPALAAQTLAAGAGFTCAGSYDQCVSGDGGGDFENARLRFYAYLWRPGVGWVCSLFGDATGRTGYNDPAPVAPPSSITFSGVISPEDRLAATDHTLSDWSQITVAGSTELDASGYAALIASDIPVNTGQNDGNYPCAIFRARIPTGARLFGLGFRINGLGYTADPGPAYFRGFYVYILNVATSTWEQVGFSSADAKAVTGDWGTQAAANYVDPATGFMYGMCRGPMQDGGVTPAQIHVDNPEFMLDVDLPLWRSFALPALAADVEVRPRDRVVLEVWQYRDFPVTTHASFGFNGADDSFADGDSMGGSPASYIEYSETLKLGEDEMAFTKANLLIGACDIEVDGVNIGGGTQGVVHRHSETKVKCKVDQRMGVVDESRVDTEDFVDIVMREMTLENMRIAYGRPASALSGASAPQKLGFGSGHDTLNEHTLTIKGVGPGKTGTRTLYVRKAVVEEVGDLKRSREEYSEVKVTFACLVDSAYPAGEDILYYEDTTAAFTFDT